MDDEAISTAGRQPASGSRVGERPSPSPAADQGPALVHVYVASFNTASATELCIRSLRSTVGVPFRLTVGDGDSKDGSLEMLRRFAQRGWLELDVAAGGRRHAEWLDLWVAGCRERYAVFVDSDVVLRRRGWLEELLAAAQENDAAFVSAGMLHPVNPKVDKQGRPLRWMPRPTPWMLLVDVDRARAAGASFGFRARDDADSGLRIMYDTGAAFLEALRDRGERWVVMPEEWSPCFHHFGGLSWWGSRRELATHRKVKLRLKRMLVWSWLQGVRVRDVLRRRDR
jgi:hypothetical protein